MLLLTPAVLLGLSSGVSAGCGTASPSEASLAIDRELLAREKASFARDLESRAASVHVPVYFHAFAKSQSEQVTDGRIKTQLEVINSEFSTTGFTFDLAGIDKFIDSSIGAASFVNAVDTEIKKHRQGGESALNIYIVPEVANGGGGYASFPWDYTRQPQYDGVVLDEKFTPEGSAGGFNTGNFAVHQVGHWMGLLHTFHDNCDGDGDHVDDTPAQNGQAYDCSKEIPDRSATRNQTYNVEGTDPEPTLRELYNLNISKAQVAAKMRRVWLSNELDVILAPGYQSCAPLNDEYGSPVYTVIWNLVDYPSCIIPFGHANEEADYAFVRDVEYTPKYQPKEVETAPCHVQVVGRRLKDEALLQHARMVEDVLKGE